MLRFILIFIFIIITNCMFAVEVPVAVRETSVVRLGEVSDSAEFVNRFFHNPDVMYYLDNFNNFVTVQQETTGDYSTTSRKIFSVAGNSYAWNRFYVDGFRVDSRFQPGSAPYDVSLYTHNVSVDYFNSNIRFSSLDSIDNQIMLTGNMGNLGGVMPGTKEMINLFHKASYERLYKPIDLRQHTVGQVSLRTSFNMPSGGNDYNNDIYFTAGRRMLTAFDENGISGGTTADFYNFQAMGQLPIKPNVLFDRTNYMLSFQHRDDLNSEFYYGINELADQQLYTASVYGTRKVGLLDYTLGLTWATNVVRLHDGNFSRNFIDQDGEAFEPWQPSGDNSEISVSFALNRKFNSWLSLGFDSYNSFVYFAPQNGSSYNTGYVRYADLHSEPDYPATALYLYRWDNCAWAGGLLENTLSLKANHRFNRSILVDAHIDFTFDAMLLGGGKSQVNPNYQASMKWRFEPCRWFAAEVNIGDYRVAYNMDQMRFFSNDYMSGKVYFLNDENGDFKFSDGEQGNLFTTTGGAYHSTGGKYLRQMRYFVFDIPVMFSFGRHHISFLQSYRKYYNMWHTSYAGDLAEVGSMVHSDKLGTDVFLLNPGECGYVVRNGYPDGIVGNNFLNNTPYYASSVIKYEYHGKKLFFSLAWQSYQMCGLSALGFGPLHNNVGVLSESMANPNTLNTELNSGSPYRALGRLDQDRAYVLWMLLSYNPVDYLSLTLNGKFRDGQPFTAYSTMIADGQLVMMPYNTRGINTMDGHFGTRDDAFFNFDLSVTGYIPVRKGDELMLRLTCYNIFDFGTELTEYIMGDAIGDKRYAMSLCVPRGMMFTLGYKFGNKND